MEDIVRPQDQFFCGLRRRNGRKGFDIGAGDEAALLGRQDHQPLGMGLGDADQLLVECFQRFFGKDVGAGILCIEVQPGDLPVVVVHTKIPVHDNTLSSSMAPPCPPPMHRLAMPRRACLRSSIFSRCRTIRAPTG